MIDDKEERIQLSLTIAEYQELIEGYIGNSEGVYEKLKNAEPTSKPQQHTDEEYDEVWARLNSCQLEWARLKLRNALIEVARK